ncbi:MAG: hypothetical protein AAF517_21645 [Planctomycetota bacterium]
MDFSSLFHSFLAAEATPGPGPSFQPYIFWAYGIACVLIAAFSVYSLRESKRVENRLRSLEERFERSSSAGGS